MIFVHIKVCRVLNMSSCNLSGWVGGGGGASPTRAVDGTHGPWRHRASRLRAPFLTRRNDVDAQDKVDNKVTSHTIELFFEMLAVIPWTISCTFFLSGAFDINVFTFLPLCLRVSTEIIIDIYSSTINIVISSEPNKELTDEIIETYRYILS